MIVWFFEGIESASFSTGCLHHGKSSQWYFIHWVTSDLIKRVYQHRNHLNDGFTKRYGCIILVYFEMSDEMLSAIMREKQIKAGSRKKKLALINSINPNWDDLYTTLID